MTIKKRPSVRWTADEVAILKKHYPLIGIGIKKYLPHKTDNQIISAANKRGLFRGGRGRTSILFTDEERKILKKYYPKIGIEVRDHLAGKQDYQIVAEAGRLGLKVHNWEWTKEELKLLTEYYKSNKKNIKLKNQLLKNRTPGAIITKANELRLARGGKRENAKRLGLK